MNLAPEKRTPTLYTPELANEALPYVRAVVDDLVDAFRRLRAAEAQRERLDRGDHDPLPHGISRHTAMADVATDHMVARRDLQRVLGELEQAGIELKDPRRGLIDFPGEMDGRPVLLCWMKGEESVAHWHDLDTGFAGRQPLPLPEAVGGGTKKGRGAAASSRRRQA